MNDDHKLKSILPCAVMLQELMSLQPKFVLQVVSLLITDCNVGMLSEHQKATLFEYCRKHQLTGLLAQYIREENNRHGKDSTEEESRSEEDSIEEVGRKESST